MFSSMISLKSKFLKLAFHLALSKGMKIKIYEEIEQLNREIFLFEIKQKYKSLIEQNKPVVAVIGARFGLGIWEDLVNNKLISAYGFEPDQDELKRLIDEKPMFSFFSYALGMEEGSATLYITENPACSSCLKPNFEVLTNYPVSQWFVIRNNMDISLHRFDSLLNQKMLCQPQFLQVDVQGFEYQVLEGMGKYLDSVLCIELEAHFKEIYKDQKLFYDLKVYLEEKGFYLRHLCQHGPFEGEVVEVNAFFRRYPKDLSPMECLQSEFWEEVCGLPPSYKFDSIGCVS
jgi:FkbM family methyltransferase